MSLYLLLVSYRWSIVSHLSGCTSLLAEKFYEIARGLHYICKNVSIEILFSQLSNQLLMDLLLYMNNIFQLLNFHRFYVNIYTVHSARYYYSINMFLWSSVFLILHSSLYYNVCVYNIVARSIQTEFLITSK